MVRGNKMSPALTKALKRADKGMAFFEAWQKEGSPGTWNNALRQ